MGFKNGMDRAYTTDKRERFNDQILDTLSRQMQRIEAKHRAEHPTHADAEAAANECPDCIREALDRLGPAPAVPDRDYNPATKALRDYRHALDQIRTHIADPKNHGGHRWPSEWYSTECPVCRHFLIHHAPAIATATYSMAPEHVAARKRAARAWAKEVRDYKRERAREALASATGANAD